MSGPIVIELGYIPPAEVRGNSRAHWRVKYKVSKDMKAAGLWNGMLAKDGMRFQPLIQLRLAQEKGTLRISFAFFHTRKIDLDNLAIGMKPFVDGLVESELLVDDDPDHVVYGEHSFTLCKKGESRTVVTIEETA